MLRSIIGGNPAFTRFWMARAASGFAYHMSAVAIGWQVYGLTGDVIHLGLVGLVEFSPQFLLTLVVGQVADRFDRRRIAGLCQAVEGVALLVLVLAGWGTELHLGAIYGCVALIGATRAFETPSLQALLPQLVPAADLPRLLAFSGSVWKTAMILGPGLGGLLCIAGPRLAFAVAAGMFFTASFGVLGIKAPIRRSERAPATLGAALEGLRFIRTRPVLLGAISLDLFAVLLGGATALLPVFAKDILCTGAWGLGVMRAAPSLGAVAMSLFLTRFPLTRSVGRIMFASVAVFGLCTLVFGLSRSFPVSVAALVGLGASDMVSVVIRASLIQLDTPDALRGRVSAVNAVFIGSSNQLGEFESGLTAALLGTVGAVLLGGIGTLVVVAVWCRLFPELARRDRFLDETTPGAPGAA